MATPLGEADSDAREEAVAAEGVAVGDSAVENEGDALAEPDAVLRAEREKEPVADSEPVAVTLVAPLPVGLWLWEPVADAEALPLSRALGDTLLVPLGL